MAEFRLTGEGGYVASDGRNIPNDPANRDYMEVQAWIAAGNTPDSYAAPPVPAPSFLARDLMTQLTSADYAAIQSAVAGSADLGLLWSSLMAQGEAPISTASARFQAGWTALAAALGAARASAIAITFGIPTS
jgi:hypothetical protein